MMRTKYLHIAAILLALAGLGWNQSRFKARQQSTGLSVASPNVPASVSLVTIALGPMRALVTNALWWRAIEHQDRGEFFDVVQLSEWITELQPNIGSVWAYLGWNMAYNISYEFSDPNDQWAWVENAIVLLRDRGLRANPDQSKNQVIRHELARIFYEKIERNEHYRTRWTFKMLDYFELGTRVDLLNMDAAAESIEALKKRPGVAEYAQAARQELGVDVFDFEKNRPPRDGLEVNLETEGRVMAGIQVYYCRARLRIEQDLGMEIKRMLFINNEFGPFDWRSNQAHAIYWAAENDWEDYVATGANYAEIVRQAMSNSFFRGRVFQNAALNGISYTPNLDNIHRIHVYYDEVLEKRYSTMMDDGHRRFLRDAVGILYTFDKREEARTLFEHYKEGYDPDGDFESFVLDSMARNLNRNDSRSKQATVEALVYKHLEWLDAGDFEQANGYFKAARATHARNWKENPAGSRERLPPFAELANSARKRYSAKRPEMTIERLKQRLDESVKVRIELDERKVGIGDFQDRKKLVRPPAHAE
ncbi:MAG TPA: hypothetical protein DCR55_11005 [Lentisphaeria bacterium]|nr:hypothetical protein [Lentisphaeria bacterium]